MPGVSSSTESPSGCAATPASSPPTWDQVSRPDRPHGSESAPRGQRSGPMLEVRDLSVGYYREIQLMRGVGTGTQPGQLTSDLRAIGVGKITFLKAIVGFLIPAAGQIVLYDVDVTGTPPHRMVDRRLAYGPQQPGIFPEMTVEENLLIGAWSFR